MKPIIFYSVVLVTIILIILVLGFKKEILVRGSDIPLLQYEGVTGMECIIRDSVNKSVIVWFHPDCGRCHYQLTLIDENFSEFNQVRLFFFTDDKIFPQERHLGKWKNLTSSKHVHFGIIDQDIFCSHFGPVVNPTIFIFNKNGELASKLFGEVKLTKLLQLINSNKVPEQENAVLNNAFNRGCRNRYIVEVNYERNNQ